MGLFNWMKGGTTLYYPGCLTKSVLKPELENYKTIFNKLGIDFIMLPDKEVCCGLPILNAGYRKDTRKLAKKNLDAFKKLGITKIITNCPSCYHTFNEIYPKILQEWDIEIEHATITILNALKNKRIKFRGQEEDREVVSYHDPCHLGRHSGIYDEPREVIELLGGKIHESFYAKENAICCGAGGGMRANFTETAKKTAKKKASFIPEHSSKIISPCGLCYSNIKSATEKSIEFSTFVLSKLRGLGR